MLFPNKAKKSVPKLFQTSVPNINIHLKNIFEEGELDAKATIKDYLIVRLERNEVGIFEKVDE